MQAGMAHRMPLSQSTDVSEEFPVDVPRFAEPPEDAIMATALACESGYDVSARIARSR